MLKKFAEKPQCNFMLYKLSWYLAEFSKVVKLQLLYTVREPLAGNQTKFFSNYTIVLGERNGRIYYNERRSFALSCLEFQMLAKKFPQSPDFDSKRVADLGDIY